MSEILMLPDTHWQKFVSYNWLKRTAVVDPDPGENKYFRRLH